MKSTLFYVCLLIGCIVMMVACKQPSDNGETQDLTFEITKSKIFTKPGQIGSTVDIVMGRNIITPLYISSYNKEKVELSFNDDFTLLNITSKTAGTEEITLTDSRGVKSSLLTIVIDPRDLKLEINPALYELKIGKSHIFVITRGVDINASDLSVVGDKYVTAILDGDGIKVTAKEVGSGTVTLSNSEGVSAHLAVKVLALNKQISITPTSSELRVGESEVYRVSKGEDGGVLVPSFTNQKIISYEQVDEQSFKVTAIAPGTATVTLTDSSDSSISTTSTVVVKELDVFFKISARNSITLKAVVPNNTGELSNKSISLIESGLDIKAPFIAQGYDNNIISVSTDKNTLTITAVGRGQSTLRLKDANGVESNSITINVFDIDFKMELTDMTIKVGETKRFTAIVGGKDNIMVQPISFYAHSLFNMATYAGNKFGELQTDGTRLFSMEITGVAETTSTSAGYIFSTRESSTGTSGSEVGRLNIKVVAAN